MSGTDAGSGVYGYSLASSADGETFTVIATTTENTYVYEGDISQTRYFRAQAIDNVGNVSEWGSAKKLPPIKENDDWADLKSAGPDGNFYVFRNFGAGASYSDQVGKEDPTDYRAFTLDSAASLQFLVGSENAAKFTVYSLQSKTDKKGVTTYSLKSLQSTTLKAGVDATTKNLLLEKGTYYVAVESTNAKKGGSADYKVAVSEKTTFFTKGDNGDDWTTMKTEGAAGLADPIPVGEGTGDLLNGWVGYGDAVDYRAFTLDRAADLSFDLDVTDAAKFSVFSLQDKTDKSGVTTHSLKSLQSTTVKEGEATTKSLHLEAGTYYLAMESTNAKKGGSVDYSVAVADQTRFYADDTDIKKGFLA